MPTLTAKPCHPRRMYPVAFVIKNRDDDEDRISLLRQEKKIPAAIFEHFDEVCREFEQRQRRRKYAL